MYNLAINGIPDSPFKLSDEDKKTLAEKAKKNQPLDHSSFFVETYQEKHHGINTLWRRIKSALSIRPELKTRVDETVHQMLDFEGLSWLLKDKNKLPEGCNRQKHTCDNWTEEHSEAHAHICYAVDKLSLGNASASSMLNPALTKQYKLYYSSEQTHSPFVEKWMTRLGQKLNIPLTIERHTHTCSELTDFVKKFRDVSGIKSYNNFRKRYLEGSNGGVNPVIDFHNKMNPIVRLSKGIIGVQRGIVLIVKVLYFSLLVLYLYKLSTYIQKTIKALSHKSTIKEIIQSAKTTLHSRRVLKVILAVYKLKKLLSFINVINEKMVEYEKTYKKLEEELPLEPITTLTMIRDTLSP